MNMQRFQRQVSSNLFTGYTRVPRRWHSGPLYRNAKKPEDPVVNTTASASTTANVAQRDGPQETPILAREDPVVRPSEENGNPHKNFYKSYSIPIMKVVLGALLTYQVVYWSWLRLGGVEKEKEGQDKISGLKKKLVEVAQERKAES